MKEKICSLILALRLSTSTPLSASLVRASRIIFSFLIVSVLIWQASAFSGTFNNLGMGAYALSMGEAFVAVPGDVNGIYYNPASLSFMSGLQAANSFALLYPGMENDHLYYNNLNAALFNKRIGGMGVAWTALISDLYQENVFYFSYGCHPVKIGNGELAFGVTPKIFTKTFGHNDYTAADPFFTRNGYAVRAFTFDAGCQYRMTARNLTLGLSAANVINSGFELTGGASSLPEFRVGASKQFDDPIESMINVINSIFVASDFAFDQNSFSFQTGLKIKIYRVADFMLGFDAGNSDYRRITAGGGYLVKIDKIRFNINYGFMMGLNEISSGTYGNHLISLRMEI